MPRKPAANPEELLIHPISLRVDQLTYSRLEMLLSNSNCKSIGEVARKILTRSPVKCFYRDISLNGPMEELALIRKELKSIGVNINQQTRYFNACKTDGEKRFHAERTLAQFGKVDEKMERLFSLISKLAERWLPKS